MEKEKEFTGDHLRAIRSVLCLSGMSISEGRRVTIQERARAAEILIAKFLSGLVADPKAAADKILGLWLSRKKGSLSK